MTRDAGLKGLVRLDALVDHIETPLSLKDQARLLFERLPESPDLVLAYCGTASLALHVAALANADAVLIDPYSITVEDLRSDFRRLCRSLGVYRDHNTQNPNLREWETVVLTARDTMAEGHGGGVEAYEFVDDLLDRYLAWLRFLFANAAAEPVDVLGQVTVISAKPTPLGALLCAPERLQTHLVEAEAGILDSEQVRTMVSALVRS